MRTRFAFAHGTLGMVIVAVLLSAASESGRPFAAVTQALAGHDLHSNSFEVWIADQSDTRPGFGGQILIYDGADLAGPSAWARDADPRVDLGARDRRPVPGCDGPQSGTAAHGRCSTPSTRMRSLSFVASGHVVIFDAESRTPLNCFETTVSDSTKTRQAHAAFPAPDGSFILVANQNGKRLERIDTNFATNTFTHNAAATLDLATCTTPSGQPCEIPTCVRSTGRSVRSSITAAATDS